MHFRKLLLMVFAVAIVTFSVGLRGQGLIDGIKVTLPEPVTIGDKVLEPGEYEIRRPSAANRDILRIYNKDKMVYETNVLTVATGPDDKDAKETKVLLHHIGGAYYFDRIWMEDKTYGWEFPLPERVRAIQREIALSVPARYEATTSGSAPEPGPGLAARLDVIAAQNEQQQASLREAESRKAEQERQALLERNRQAELDRQAQLDRDRQAQSDRDRVAVLQPEPAPFSQSQSDARVTEPQSSIQSNSEAPGELPRTATNWVALVLSGALLLTVSFIVRPGQ